MTAAYKKEYSKRHEEYRKNKYKIISLNIDKEYYNNILVPAAAAENIPIQTFIKKAIDKYINNPE